MPNNRRGRGRGGQQIAPPRDDKRGGRRGGNASGATASWPSPRGLPDGVHIINSGANSINIYRDRINAVQKGPSAKTDSSVAQKFNAMPSLTYSVKGTFAAPPAPGGYSTGSVSILQTLPDGYGVADVVLAPGDAAWAGTQWFKQSQSYQSFTISNVLVHFNSAASVSSTGIYSVGYNADVLDTVPTTAAEVTAQIVNSGIGTRQAVHREWALHISQRYLTKYGKDGNYFTCAFSSTRVAACGRLIMCPTVDSDTANIGEITVYVWGHFRGERDGTITDKAIPPAVKINQENFTQGLFVYDAGEPRATAYLSCAPSGNDTVMCNVVAGRAIIVDNGQGDPITLRAPLLSELTGKTPADFAAAVQALVPSTATEVYAQQINTVGQDYVLFDGTAGTRSWQSSTSVLAATAPHSTFVDTVTHYGGVPAGVWTININGTVTVVSILPSNHIATDLQEVLPYTAPARCVYIYTPDAVPTVGTTAARPTRFVSINTPGPGPVVYRGTQPTSNVSNYVNIAVDGVPVTPSTPLPVNYTQFRGAEVTPANAPCTALISNLAYISAANPLFTSSHLSGSDIGNSSSQPWHITGSVDANVTNAVLSVFVTDPTSLTPEQITQAISDYFEKFAVNVPAGVIDELTKDTIDLCRIDKALLPSLMPKFERLVSQYQPRRSHYAMPSTSATFDGRRIVKVRQDLLEAQVMEQQNESD